MFHGGGGDGSWEGGWVEDQPGTRPAEGDGIQAANRRDRRGRHDFESVPGRLRRSPSR